MLQLYKAYGAPALSVRSLPAHCAARVRGAQRRQGAHSNCLLRHYSSNFRERREQS